MGTLEKVKPLHVLLLERLGLEGDRCVTAEEFSEIAGAHTNLSKEALEKIFEHLDYRSAGILPAADLMALLVAAAPQLDTEHVVRMRKTMHQTELSRSSLFEQELESDLDAD